MIPAPCIITTRDGQTIRIEALRPVAIPGALPNWRRRIGMWRTMERERVIRERGVA